jgi:hypothetical protein
VEEGTFVQKLPSVPPSDSPGKGGFVLSELAVWAHWGLWDIANLCKLWQVGDYAEASKIRSSWNPTLAPRPAINGNFPLLKGLCWTGISRVSASLCKVRFVDMAYRS